MFYYHFAIQNDGTGIESLGGWALADDGAALTFGKRVIQDLLETDADRYATWAMDIAEGARVVGSIPFEALMSPQGGTRTGSGMIPAR